MNLGSKKDLAKRTFNVGKERIVFVDSRIEDINDAITKQDMRDLLKDGAIVIKTVSGRRRNAGKRRRENRKVRKNVNVRKKTYVRLTRKLRKHIAESKSRGEISPEEFLDVRKKIRNKAFRSKMHLKEHLNEKKNKMNVATTKSKGKGKGKAKSKTNKSGSKK